MARPELLSVVIPCYRSEGYLEKTVRELTAALDGWCPFEVVLVNDGSPDGVQAVIERLADSDARVRYLQLGTNRGQHFATLRGFAVSRGDVVVTVDDDGQNPPEAVKLVVERLRADDLDVVYGAFEVVAQAPLRRLASAANRWMTKHTLGNHRGLALSNVRAVRGQLARVVSQAGNSTPYIDALLWRSTRRIEAVTVAQRTRDDGVSTYSLWKLLALWVSHLTLLTVLPLQVVSVGSMVVSALAFVLGVAQMARVVIAGGAPEGWLSLFVVTTMLFSLLFFCLGVVGTYVGRVYVELNARGLDWVRSSSDDRPRDDAAPP